MFKKQKKIEDDFMAYTSDSSFYDEPFESPEQNNDVPKDERNILGTIIQVLMILVLLGVLFFVALFGYRYFVHSTPDVQPTPVKSESLAVSQPIQKVEETPTSQNEKLYTKAEMQAIVRTMMEEMERKQKEQVQSTEVADTEKHKQTTEDGDDMSLVSSLEEVQVDQVDQVEDVDVSKVTQNINQKISSDTQNKVDYYNKVVIKKNNNSYDKLDQLSKEISAVVQDMEQKKVKKVSEPYTTSIQKEVKARSDAMRVVVVKKGDTLSKISQRAYGSALAYDRIVKANPDLIKNAHNIYVGQRLRVPLAEK